jgi:hypothetical protein
VFPLPFGPSLNLALYALLVLEIALLAGGLVFGTMNVEETGRLPRPLRMVLSLVLVIAALLGWLAGARGSPAQGFAALVAFGMLAGHAGDLIMAQLIPVPNRLIFGMIAFGIGHMFYIAALANATARAGVWNMPTHVIALVVSVAFCLWAWRTYVRRPGGSKVINIGSLAYGIVIAVMVALGAALAIRQPQFLNLAAGGLLFLASDFVLGNWQVRGHAWKPVNDVIWVCYVLGQMQIVYSIAAAVRLWG